MSGGQRRPIIQLSLGPTANAVSAHMLNLQGLSVTSSPSSTAYDSISGASAVCDPVITHRVDSDGNPVWVPRVLLVDESHRIQRTTTSTANDSNSAQMASQQLALAAPIHATNNNVSEIANATWSGAVQEVSMDTFSFDPYFLNATSGGAAAADTEASSIVTNFSYNSNSHEKNRETPSWLSSWHQTANQLAYAPYSQYRLSPSQQQQSPYHDFSQQQQQQQSDQNSRYVDWDDMGEEPDPDEEMRQAALPPLRERQRREQMHQWNGERQQHEAQLSKLWASSGQAGLNKTDDDKKKRKEPSQNDDDGHSGPSEEELDRLSWLDYWMPPHPSPLTHCTYGLPSTSAASSLGTPPLYSYSIASNSDDRYSKIILEEYWEKLRLELERTDACQGFSILTEGCGIYAGMTNWLLQELQQECKAAGRWVFHVVDDDDHAEDDDDEKEDANDENILGQGNGVPRTSKLAKSQRRVRNHVQRGLALAGVTDNAHVVVPLRLPSRKNKSLFRASAELAMALETATLPYRCQASSQATMVGWNSTKAYEEGAAPSGMSLSDYLATLQPSSRYSLLELDTVVTRENRQRLGQVLVSGTSVERDPRMRRPPSSLGTEYPGSWMLDEHFGSTATAGQGILTSLSPGHSAKQDRSLHRHFGLSTCMRRSMVSDSPMLQTNQHYLTCLMEGMGIRYQPETVFGLVTNQSLTQLAKGGAGSYWNYLFGADVEVPVVSVLGNTTRMYGHLHTVAKDMKDALKSSKTQGLYQREVADGILPEADDCEESMEHCLDLRDVYEPPNGSRYDEDDGDQYMDE